MTDKTITHEQLLADATWVVDRFPETAKTLRRAAATIAALTAEVERLRGGVKEAYHEGYEDAVDPAWVEKTLRHNGMDIEPHEAVGWFWERSETRAALALPTPGANGAPPEATDGK